MYETYCLFLSRMLHATFQQYNLCMLSWTMWLEEGWRAPWCVITSGIYEQFMSNCKWVIFISVEYRQHGSLELNMIISHCWPFELDRATMNACSNVLPMGREIARHGPSSTNETGLGKWEFLGLTVAVCVHIVLLIVEISVLNDI